MVLEELLDYVFAFFRRQSANLVHDKFDVVYRCDTPILVTKCLGEHTRRFDPWSRRHASRREQAEGTRDLLRWSHRNETDAGS